MLDIICQQQQKLFQQKEILKNLIFSMAITSSKKSSKEFECRKAQLYLHCSC